jgi:hypothetical protein
MAASSSPIAIDIGGLSLTFQTADTPVVALEDINLTVRRGEIRLPHRAFGLRQDHTAADYRPDLATPSAAA